MNMYIERESETVAHTYAHTYLQFGIYMHLHIHIYAYTSVTILAQGHMDLFLCRLHSNLVPATMASMKAMKAMRSMMTNKVMTKDELIEAITEKPGTSKAWQTLPQQRSRRMTSSPSPLLAGSRLVSSQHPRLESG